MGWPTRLLADRRGGEALVNAAWWRSVRPDDATLVMLAPLQATLVDIVNACVEEHADQTALIFKDRALTFGEPM